MALANSGIFIEIKLPIQPKINIPFLQKTKQKIFGKAKFQKVQ